MQVYIQLTTNLGWAIFLYSPRVHSHIQQVLMCEDAASPCYVLISRSPL